MKIQLQNIEQRNIVFFDIEYDQNLLVQTAFLILSEVEPGIYELTRSINIYLRPDRALNSFFRNYTNINNDYLCDNGIDQSGAKALMEEVIFDIDPQDCLIVSHGVDDDINLLCENGFCFDQFVHRYCTYNNARKLLKRKKDLKLRDVAKEGGYILFNEHNAYADVWGTLYAFCFLNELENSQNEVV